MLDAAMVLDWMGAPPGCARCVGQGDEQRGGFDHVLCLFFYCMLDAFNDCPLPLNTDLLGTLESDEGELEVVRCLLQGRLVSWLEVSSQRTRSLICPQACIPELLASQLAS